MKKHLLLSALITFMVTLSYGQENPLPLNVQEAYKNGTRSDDGLPGPEYWQNSSDYVIDVRIDTDTEQINGAATIHYSNQSPDTLRTIILRLYQDFFRKGNARQWPISEGDLTEGMKITRLVIGGTEYDPEKDFPRWWMTNFRIRLKEKIAPGTITKIEVDWSFDIPTEQGLRMRKYDDGHYFIAYWYPQVAVYDDVDGWDRVEYLGMVEFYNDFNNYTVNLTVPGDYVVWATGELQNMEAVFQPAIIERVEQAKASDEVVRIITQRDYSDGPVTLQNKENTWTFTATGVPDFSFALSTHANWDGTSLVVDEATGRRVFTDVVYPDDVNHWENGAELSMKSIEYMSKVLPGVPFPYPQMTSFCGTARGGGMETPMMANDGAPRRYIDFAEVLFHEISHTYFPFYMGNNERKYAWMDEGWASFLPTEFTRDVDPESDYMKESVEGYTFLAGQEAELPLMVPSYQHNSFSSARVSAYTRPNMAYHFLRDALGDKLFKKALKEYMHRWNGKHPLPYDFFNTFEEVAGEDLDWFWEPWFYKMGYPDLAIKEVTAGNAVVIEKIGTHPIPISLYYQTEEGSSEKVYHSTAVWKDGMKIFKVQLPSDLTLTRIEIGNDHIPDVVKDNNTWNK
jgi:hypothetical protein